MNHQQTKPELPNSTAVLILGIGSLVFTITGCAFAPMILIGLVLGIISLALSGTGLRLNREMPGMYSGYGNLQGGRICAIVSLSLVAFAILMLLVAVLFFGTLATSGPFFYNF